MHNQAIKDKNGNGVEMVNNEFFLIFNGVRYKLEVEFIGKIIHPDGTTELIKPKEE
jgi:hypothetical protein